MLQFFKKAVRKDAQVAVYQDERSISVARVKRDRDTPPLLEYCEAQLVDNISLQDAELARLIHTHHLNEYECIGMMTLGNYNLLLVEAPDVQPEELRAAIRWRIKDLIDFHIDDAVVDVFEVPNQKTAGKNRMMYAVVARADQVKQRIEQLTNAGLNLDIIDIPELALRNIAAMLPEDVGGVALVYISDNSGLITITRQSTLYFSRWVDIGLEELPDFSNSTEDEQVRSWLDNIVIEVQRSLDYYESHFSQPQVSAIVISPINKNIPGMLEYLSGQFDVKVRSLDINSLIDALEPVHGEIQPQSLLAIGAALRQESVAL